MLKDSKGQPLYLGITPPISITSPSQADLELTKTLEKALRNAGQFESEDDALKREWVLGRLAHIIREFVRKVPTFTFEDSARDAGGKIFTFGSYRLGVYNSGSDIDTLCVAPRHVEREHFFEVMYDLLQKTEDVTELTKVEDAYVPLIKMSFAGVDIDLVFAKLDRPDVPEDLELYDDNLLVGLDERCIRSLNGSRVADEIIRLVPNVETFKLSLKCIKLWAKNRAIYSNIIGFFGGVAWAMLVARICQFYPNAVAGIIVWKFFRIIYQWQWPQPILLKQIDEGPLRVWNPKVYLADRNHRMPVITPAYPSMCATHNVTESTQKIITLELHRAADIVDKVACGLAQWPELWEKHEFFGRYRHYLQIIASSDSEEKQLKLSGMVESRIRQLILKLETVDIISLVHPFIKSFDKVHHCKTLQERWDAGRGMKSMPQDDGENDEEAGDIHTATFYIGLHIQPKTQNTSGTRRLDLTSHVKSFRELVSNWEYYDAKAMHVEVNTIKRSMLPPEVFEGNSQTVKPNQSPGPPLKRKKLAKTELTGSKRLRKHESVEVISATNGSLITDANISNDPVKIVCTNGIETVQHGNFEETEKYENKVENLSHF